MSDVIDNPKHKLVTQLLVIVNNTQDEPELPEPDPVIVNNGPSRPTQPLPRPKRPMQPLPEPIEPAAEPENLTLTILDLDIVNIINDTYKIICLPAAIPCKIEVGLKGVVLQNVEKNALFAQDLKVIARSILVNSTNLIFKELEALDLECEKFYSKGAKRNSNMAGFLSDMQIKLDAQAILLGSAVKDLSDGIGQVVLDLIGAQNASKLIVRSNKCLVAISLFKGASTVVMGSVIAGVTFGATTPLAIYAIARDIGGIVELITALVTDAKTKEKRITAYFNMLDKCLIELNNPDDKLKKNLTKVSNTTLLSAAAIASEALNINLPDIGSMGELIESYMLDLVKMDHHRTSIGKKIAALNNKIAQLKKEIEASPSDEKLDELLQAAEDKKQAYLDKAETMRLEITTRMENAQLIKQRFQELEKMAYSATSEVNTVAGLFIGVALVAGGSGDGLELLLGLMTDIGQNLFDRFGEDAIAWLVERIKKRLDS